MVADLALFYQQRALGHLPAGDQAVEEPDRLGGQVRGIEYVFYGGKRGDCRMYKTRPDISCPACAYKNKVVLTSDPPAHPILLLIQGPMLRPGEVAIVLRRHDPFFPSHEVIVMV